MLHARKLFKTAVQGMNIGIEMRPVTLGNSGGVAILLRGVLRTLFARYPHHTFICFSTIFNRDLIGHTPSNVEVHTFPLFRYSEDVGRLCKQNHVEVLFRGYPMDLHLSFPSNRQVVLIPDLQHEYLPDCFDPETLSSRGRVLRSALAGAGAIGTISEFARQSLLDHFTSIPRRRDIFLMSPALQVEHQGDEPLTLAEERLIPRGDFFLYPANLWPHKNHRRILRAFASFQSRSRRPSRSCSRDIPTVGDRSRTNSATCRSSISASCARF